MEIVDTFLNGIENVYIYISKDQGKVSQMKVI